MTEEELQKTPSFKYQKKVSELCQVLDDLYNITFFRFARIHKTLGTISLGNSLCFALHYWNEYAKADVTNHPEHYYHRELFIYNGIKTAINKKEKEMYEIRLKNYNLSDQGVILINRTPEYLETFNFSSIKYQSDRLNPLIENTANLRLFCKFFLKEIQDILKDKNNYTPIILADLQSKIFSPIIAPNFNEQHKQLTEKKFNHRYTKKFLKEHLSEITAINLTPAEMECLSWAIKGKTADETALILKRSRRTIEGHLSSLRTKLNCHKTSTAILKAEEIGLIRNGQVLPNVVTATTFSTQAKQ